MDRLLITWREMAEYCGVSFNTMRRMRGRLLEEGVIFRRRRRYGKWVYCAWAEDLRKIVKK